MRLSGGARGAERLGEQLERMRALIYSPPAWFVPPERMLVTTWQSRRMEQTHADLLRSDRYRRATEFFLYDLYGSRSFTHHNQDFERVAPAMSRLLPDAVLHAMAEAVEMNVLSQELDARLERVLREELGVTDRLEAEALAEAFRRTGDWAGRERQSELFRSVGEALDRAAGNVLVRAALRLAGRPARMMGLGRLHDFMERGFDAFHAMRGAEEFLRTVIGRERAIVERIRSGHPRPFDPPAY